MRDVDGDGWGDINAPRRGKAGTDYDDTRASMNDPDEDNDGQNSVMETVTTQILMFMMERPVGRRMYV